MHALKPKHDYKGYKKTMLNSNNELTKSATVLLSEFLKWYIYHCYNFCLFL